MSLIISLVIFCINFALRKIIRIFTKYERMRTKTDYQLSISFKLSVAMFVNSAIIPLLVNKNPNTWFVKNGLNTDVFFIMTVIAILMPLTEYLQMDY